MRLTRRDLLRGGLAASTLAACAKPGADDDSGGPVSAAPRPSEPAQWAPSEGTLDEGTFAYGCSSGDVTSNQAILLARTAAADVSVVVVAEQNGAWVEVARVDGLSPQGESVKVTVDGLAADTAHRYVFVAGDSRSAVGRFRTALAAGSSRQLSFGATSCLGGNHPWTLLSHAATEQLDFFCLLGDTTYCDGSVTLEDYRSVWREAMGTRGMQDLVASTSLLATWDDHETTDNANWDEVTDEMHEAAVQTMLESLPCEMSGVGDNGPAWWRSFSYGDVAEVFVLDCRSERLDGRYISVAQMDWLKAGLRASKARFKIILNSVPITDMSGMIGSVAADDRWQGYPAQRSELINFIADNEVAGVLWITGDVHFGQIGWLDAAGGVGAAMPEVYAGPGGSEINPLAFLVDPNEQYPVLIAEWNWARFDLDPGLGTLRVRHFNDANVAISDWLYEGLA